MPPTSPPPPPDPPSCTSSPSIFSKSKSKSSKSGSTMASDSEGSRSSSGDNLSRAESISQKIKGVLSGRKREEGGNHPDESGSLSSAFVPGKSPLGGHISLPDDPLTSSTITNSPATSNQPLPSDQDPSSPVEVMINPTDASHGATSPLSTPRSAPRPPLRSEAPHSGNPPPPQEGASSLQLGISAPPLGLPIQVLPPQQRAGDSPRPGESDADYHLRLVTSQAEDSVDRLTMASTWLSVAGVLLESGTSWMPMVGEAVGVIVKMLDSEKLSPWQRKRSTRSGVSARVRQITDRFVKNIRYLGRLLARYSQCPFIKLWLRSQEVTSKIQEAQDDLSNFIEIFHIEMEIHIASTLEEGSRDGDENVDDDLFGNTLTASLHDEGLMMKTLLNRPEEIPEARKTLQRVLGNLDALAASPELPAHPPPEPDNAPPLSPLALDTPNLFFVPSMRQASTVVIPTPPYVPSAPSSVRLFASSTSLVRQNVSLPTLSSNTSSPESQRGGQQRQSGQAAENIRTYVQKALDVLSRHSAPHDFDVPDWTIGPLEITHDACISRSFFSEVYRGIWQNSYTVAIKQLNSVSDSTVFKHEVEVWRRLRNKHILPFYGASSTTGPGPWFIVSPYMKNGNILSYLLNYPNSGVAKRSSRVDLIYEMALGLEHLHSRDIIHGDFKAANVLVSDAGEALICDFGLSQLKSEVAISQGLQGSMRWQPPERLQGRPGAFSADVYAFAISVCELYTATLPFGNDTDGNVRRSVLAGMRPSKPHKMPHKLWDLVQDCWAQDPGARPRMFEVVNRLARMREAESRRKETADTIASESTESATSHIAPDGTQHELLPEVDAEPPESGLQPPPSNLLSNLLHAPSNLLPAPSVGPSARSEMMAEEYCEFLLHELDDRLTVPLWRPSIVELGSVGYVRGGRFIKLFNADHPPEHLPGPPKLCIGEFGAPETVITKIDSRGVIQWGWESVRGLDTVNKVLSWVNPTGHTSETFVSRRVTFPLRSAATTARLVVEDAQFEIYRSTDEARDYLMNNIAWIMQHFGAAHNIAREDVILVFGALTAAHHAMVVSAYAPNTAYTFNVTGEDLRMPGVPWGTWTSNRKPGFMTPGTGMMKVDKDNETQFACKVSKVSASPRDAVLLAKFKFTKNAVVAAMFP